MSTHFSPEALARCIAAYNSPENQAALAQRRAEADAESQRKRDAGLVYRPKSNKWVKPRK